MAEMTPAQTAAISQQAARLRDDFDKLGINLSDPDFLFAVKVTTLLLTPMSEREHLTFFECLRAIG